MAQPKVGQSFISAAVTRDTCKTCRQLSQLTSPRRHWASARAAADSCHPSEPGTGSESVLGAQTSASRTWSGHSPCQSGQKGLLIVILL